MMSNNKCSIFESTGGGAQSYSVDKCPHYRVNFYCSGTVGTGEAARFTEYEGFHIPVVLIIHKQT